MRSLEMSNQFQSNDEEILVESTSISQGQSRTIPDNSDDFILRATEAGVGGF